MPEDLAIHPQTKRSLEAFIKHPSHALLLVGPSGSGKLTLARYTAAKVLAVKLDELSNYPYFEQISRPDDKKGIGIDAVRGISKSLRLKTPGKSAVRKVVILEDAQLMNLEAQNAFLKSLEEPNEGTLLILTVDSASSLLPTVASRTSRVVVHPIGLEEARHFFGDKSGLESAWQLSDGRIGLLSALVSEASHPLKASTAKAKELLRQDKFHRLIELDAASKNKEEFTNLLEGLSRVLRALYRQAAKANNSRQLSKVTKAMRQVSQSQQDLEANALPRLVALHLALHLPL